MKNAYLILSLFLLVSGHALSQYAQDTVPPQPAPPPQPAQGTQAVPATQPQKTIDYSGGYGYFFTGLSWIEPADLVSHLQSPEVFGSAFNWDNLAINTGFEGFAEIHRLLVGGGGFGSITQNMESDLGVLRFAFGGGYAKVGYVVYQQPRYFASLMAGFGGGVMYVGIENTSDQTPIYFSSNNPVFPRGDEDYFRGFLLYDLAVNNKFIATKINQSSRKFGGLMVGLDLGATIALPVDTWRDDEGAVTGIPSPGSFVSPYLRLTIGGGGFRKHYDSSR
ncbi:MAG: hypothetical protein SH808_12555 [Saprospiraceae bacterium]|nr:hypothetical protein [Saprospiraceae bacterium]